MKDQKKGHNLHSFILDPFLLVGVGFLIIYWIIPFIYKKFLGAKGQKVAIFYGITLAIFWIASGALYFDVYRFPFLGDIGRGNNFMWNSGIELFGARAIVDTDPPTYMDFTSPTNLLALGIFLTYPFFLYLGIIFGRRFLDKKKSAVPSSSPAQNNTAF